MTTIVTFSKMKGGTGCTTTLSHVAGLMAASGKRILILDADCQLSLAKAFGVDVGDGSAYKVLKGDYEAGDLTYVQQGGYTADMDPSAVCVFDARDNIDILSGNTLNVALESEISAQNTAAQMIRMQTEMQVQSSGGDTSTLGEFKPPFPLDYLRGRIEGFLSDLGVEYDYVFIDTGARGILQQMAMYAADHIVIPIGCEPLEVATMTPFFQTLNGVIDGRGQDAPTISIAPTKYSEVAGSVSQTILAQLKDKYGDLVGPAVHSSRYIPQASAEGKLIWENGLRKDRLARVVSSLSSLTDWLGSRWGENEPAPSETSGALDESEEPQPAPEVAGDVICFRRARFESRAS